MRRLTTFGLLIGAALLAVLIAPGLTRAQAAPQNVSITLSEFMISPMSFTATQNQPVHFTVTNSGKFPHSVSFVKDGKFSTVFAKPLAGGQSGTADFTFTEAGSWQMYCPVGSHAEQGMTGQVTVMAAGASGPGMPSTGHGSDPLLPIAAVLGLALLGGGLAVRRQMRRAA